MYFSEQGCENFLCFVATSCIIFFDVICVMENKNKMYDHKKRKQCMVE